MGTEASERKEIARAVRATAATDAREGAAC